MLFRSVSQSRYRRYRNKDNVTDVLSFPSYDELRRFCPQDQELFLGDMAICLPQAKRQSRKYEITFMDEFIHLFFHGIIHLMGYDHELSQREEKIMEFWENLALKKFSEVIRKFKKGPTI